MIEALDHWAAETPDRPFLAERVAGDWVTTPYGEARRKAGAVAATLLDRGLGGGQRLLVLSDNSVGQAILGLGAMMAGTIIVPVSPAYSLLSKDHDKLRGIAEAVAAKMIYVEAAAPFAPALKAASSVLGPVEVVTSNGEEGTTSLEALAEDGRDAGIADGVGPDTVARILFTSGSTGRPKGVMVTQGMLTSNQAAIRMMWPFLANRPPVIVDWLPWSHTFGANHNLGIILTHGGTLYIDAGKPVPGRFEETLKNLRSVRQTLHFNVPRGYDMLLAEMEADTSFRDAFFADLDMVFFAGAALPKSSWDRLRILSDAARGREGRPRVFMTSGWGATETAPLATGPHYETDGPQGNGIPVPGVEIKIIPDGDKQEIRVRGPNVTPGYWGDAERTAAAFDADGFYKTGDAVRFLDPDDPGAGLLFDGRLAEDFKLATGTWVGVGALRVAVVTACAPLVQDVVIAGHDRDTIGVLLFPAPGQDLATSGARAALAEALGRHNAANPASSTRIAAALVLDGPPSIDAGEITDKGYINQRAVLDRREDAVARLFSDDPEVIRPV